MKKSFLQNKSDFERAYFNFSGVQTNSLKDIIKQCIEDWNWHLNPNDNGNGVDFCFFQISTPTGAQIKFEEVNDPLQSNINASTHLIDANGNDMGTIRPKTENWASARIVLNYAGFPKDANGNIIFNTARGIINHEIGHALGLDENPNDNGTIMWEETSTRTAHVPTAADLTGIRNLYA